MTSKDEQLF